MSKYYIASCVFTSKFPELSQRIQWYVNKKHDIEIVRCCIPGYKIKIFEDCMPEGPCREAWKQLPDCASFSAEDEIYSICHNCSNIIEEMNHIKVKSIWELILSDADFVFPDHSGQVVTVQDCWRSKERADEQAAVRGILEKMHYTVLEAKENHGDTEFCGSSLLRKQPPRNPKLAPKKYQIGAVGKFHPCTPKEQVQIMQDYCAKLPAQDVICYCHYCLEGLQQGGARGKHLAELLF